MHFFNSLAEQEFLHTSVEKLVFFFNSLDSKRFLLKYQFKNIEKLIRY